MALGPWAAHDGTRDGKADLSEGSRWWCGPDFLKLPPEDFPQERRKDDVEEDEEETELRREFVGVIVEAEEFAVPEVARFSNYMRLLRSTGYILRLSDRLRKLAVSRQLPIRRAEMRLCKRSQWTSFPQEMQLLSSGQPVPKNSRLYELSPVLDKDGVLRMDSRLASSNCKGLRQPVILDPKEQLTVLLLGYYHKIFGHAGEDLVRNEVRQRFWIPRIRSAVRRCIGACLVCRKKRAQAHPPVMAALPDIKIQPQPRPFYITGMDYFGPMDVTIGRRHEKRCGVLFTCMNTRAVHLEVAASLSTDSCIMAIRRMIARRGQPFQLYSDNGTNLRGADKELRQALKDLDQERISDELETKQIEWHFIPPSAAHMGGSWERLVRSVKVALSAVLKCRAPKEEILLTVFAEAEAIVNSRPLVEVPVDPESPEALTPFHFLIGSSSASSPPGKFDETRVNLEKLWRQSQALADQFWKRWLKEYLPTLQRRAKWHKQRPSIEKGDMVVVLDQSLRRSTWPLGLVVQTFPGKDGIVRVAEVKTSTGIYTRPVVKLAKLDVKAVGTDHRD